MIHGYGEMTERWRNCQEKSQFCHRARSSLVLRRTIDVSGVTGGYTSGQTIFGTGTISWDTSLLGSTGDLKVIPERCSCYVVVGHNWHFCKQ
jgi:hypothetical protein